MGVFWLMTPLINSIGRNIAYAWEVDGCDDIEQISNRIANAGTAFGNRLEVESDGTDKKLIRRRIPTALTVKGIAAITPLTWRLIEE